MCESRCVIIYDTKIWLIQPYRSWSIVSNRLRIRFFFFLTSDVFPIQFDRFRQPFEKCSSGWSKLLDLECVSIELKLDITDSVSLFWDLVLKFNYWRTDTDDVCPSPRMNRFKARSLVEESASDTDSNTIQTVIKLYSLSCDASHYSN